MTRGTDTAYKLVRQYKLKLAWGTDTFATSSRTTSESASYKPRADTTTIEVR